MNLSKKLGGAVATAAIMVTAAGVVPAAAEGSRWGGNRGTTTVKLDEGTIKAVEGLGLTPSAVAPGTLSGLTATFPIVGKIRHNIVRHKGGLALSGSGKTLALTEYTINGNTGVLTTEAELNGKDLGRVTLFDLSNVKTGQKGCAVTADLKLDEEAAGALTKVFNAPDLTGAHFGSACVAPRAGRGHHDRDGNGR